MWGVAVAVPCILVVKYLLMCYNINVIINFNIIGCLIKKFEEQKGKA